MIAIPAGYESDESDMDFLAANLKITRLQDITTGAGLNGQNFDATLSHELQNFLESFRTSWNSSRRSPQPQLHQTLKTVLQRSDDPLLLALKLFANCPDSANLKNKSFSFFVLDTTCKIYRQQPSVGEKCDDNTRMIAYNFIKTAGIVSLNKAMIETYQIRKIKNLVLPKLRELHEKTHYKETAQWAIQLELTHEFDMIDLAFPLIAQERISLVEEYLDVAANQRLPMVKFLDSLLHKDKSVIEMCEPTLDRYKNVNASLNILSYRPLSKLVARLAKKYKFDDLVTPNYKFTKTCSYLHYLYREYQKGSMSVAAYRELVHDNAENKAIQKDIVAYIAQIGDHSEAVMWYNTFQMTIDDCPIEIKGMVSTNAKDIFKNRLDTKVNTTPNEEEYLTFDLVYESIIIVDTNEHFEQMLQQLAFEQMIYFDSEWKQYICNKNQLCLLQIAVANRVYLIDCLSTKVDAEMWRTLGSNIFNNMNILKVGFSMRQDLVMLQSSLPLQLKLQSPGHYLDLRCLWQHLKKQPNAITLPFGCLKRSGDALSDLTSICLGKKLNKSNQCSNWANRPLRHDQVLYAALDARCLMLIYKTLSGALPLSGLKIDNVIDKVVTSKANNFTKRAGSEK